MEDRFAVLGDEAAIDRDGLISALEAVDAEARPAWKPMHLQPLYRDGTFVGGSVAADAFARGVCLPSGSAMTDDELERVIDAAGAALADA